MDITGFYYVLIYVLQIINAFLLGLPENSTERIIKSVVVGLPWSTFIDLNQMFTWLYHLRGQFFCQSSPSLSVLLSSVVFEPNPNMV